MNIPTKRRRQRELNYNYAHMGYTIPELIEFLIKLQKNLDDIQILEPAEYSFNDDGHTNLTISFYVKETPIEKAVRLEEEKQRFLRIELQHRSRIKTTVLDYILNMSEEDFQEVVDKIPVVREAKANGSECVIFSEDDIFTK